MAAPAAAPLSDRDCETKRAILEAARRRFLHYGYKKTTIDEIAMDAGVGKGTVYLYFCGKEDLLLSIACEVKRNITEQMRAISSSLASPEEKLRRMLIARVLSIHDAYTSTAHGIELLDASMEARLSRQGKDEHDAQQALIAQVLHEGVRRGDFALPADDAERAAHCLSLAFAGFFPPYVRVCSEGDNRCRMTMQSRVEMMMDFLLSGIRWRNPA